MFDFLMFKRCLSFFFYLFFLCPCRVCRCLFPIQHTTHPCSTFTNTTDTAKLCSGSRGSSGGVPSFSQKLIATSERTLP
uniref:Secreted peptide n=1 Tax=Anopheles braziliensis TaxID=58242 RepID=A0A2M3ZLQ8_9DIPT